MRAADYNFLAINKVVNSPVAEFLHYLNYMVDFNEAEDEKIRQVNSGNGAK